MLFSGWVINYLRKSLEWNTLKVYRAVFWGYAALGVVKVLLSIALSSAVEAEKKATPLPSSETAPLLPTADVDDGEEPKRKYAFRSLLPDISKESRPIVFNLCLLFALDAFASGLAPL